MAKPLFTFFAISFFLLLLTFSYPQPVISRPYNNVTDLDSLLTFKSHVADPYGILATNWTTDTSFCFWIGINCSERHQRVTAISLRSFPLQGRISPHLGNLSFLSHLDLANCTLTGPIPDSLTRLPRLAIITLHNNSLSGPIPLGFFNMSSLIKFGVAWNSLSGSLPSNYSFTVLPNIQFFSVSFNHMTGKIPISLTQCKELQTLSLSVNNFSGNIPAELGSLPKLKVMYFGLNHFSGKIPPSLGNLTSLDQFELGFNNLTGTIPDELGNLSNLKLFYLAGNSLTGSIPKFFLNASLINILDVSTNRLTGTVPPGIGRYMPNLLRFSLARNELSGGLDFLKSLTNCRELQYIHLVHNSFKDVLPDFIGNFSTKLEIINIGANYISGNIPAAIGNLTGLFQLYLGKNYLTGAIPPELGRLEKLQSLNLTFNKLSGQIPSEIGQLKMMTELSLQGNRLSGPIPYALGSLTTLQHLSLANNSLSSSIPKNLWTLDNLIDLDLSYNSLVGEIPSGIADLRSLNALNLSNNLFSGNISNAFGSLQMLTFLDLSNNSFRGPIPQALSELGNIKYLNLSHNFLSDVIPRSLGNLSDLSILDLSFNKLEGQIPEGGAFSNPTIPLLKGNEALCGAPWLGFASCSRKGGVGNMAWKRYIFEYTIPALGFTIVLVAFLCILLKCLRRRRGKPASTDNIQWSNDYRLISYHELVRATNNFNEANLLGRGSHSSVFKACLNDGMPAAVKVVNLAIEGASKSFDTECQALSTVRHRNLVKVISTCSNLDFKSLILQFMQNGSLEKWLHSDALCLSLIQRINIMVDVSLALEHLHHHHPDVIVHQDLKPSNVLLDEHMVAYVGDFGIARFLFGDSMASLTASAPGTIGYMAPEYGFSGKISRMGDVYSFGILLLETFTGEKPTAEMFSGELSLRQWVSSALSVEVLEIADGDIFRDDSLTERTPEVLVAIHECLSSVMELGLACSKDSPKERISMTDVVPRLRKIKAECMAAFTTP